MNSDPFTVWANQLLEYQRQYQDAWHAFSTQSHPAVINGGAANGSNPWVSALEHWWGTVRPGAPLPVQDFYGKLIEQGKAYFQMTEGLNKTLRTAGTVGESTTQWHDAFDTALSSLKDTFSGHHELPGAAQQAMAFWELPLNNWQRVVSSLSILPGDLLQGVNVLDVARVRDELHGRVDQLLSTPAVGHVREHQEQFQTLAKLTLDYQQALHDYSVTFGEIGVKCVDALQQQVRERVEQGKQIASLRELYDLWVDSCEEAYAAHVNTDQYVALYGRLVNSVMALKRHGGMMDDETLGALNMPTRGEIDTLHGRLHEMRWEEKALRGEINAMKDQLEKLAAEGEKRRDEDTLRTDVETMNKQLQTLAAQQNASASGANSKPGQAAANKKSSRAKSSKKTIKSKNKTNPSTSKS